MSEESFGPSRGNFYTASRNVQELIGKLPDGSYIWGGPYTVPQVLSGVATFIVALGARQIGLWGGTGAGALIFDLLVIFALSVGVIFLVGKIPPPKRSIFGLIGGVSNLLAAPDAGMWRGRALPAARQPKKPKKKSAKSHGETTGVDEPASEEAEHKATPQKTGEPMCGLDLLLAQHKH